MLWILPSGSRLRGTRRTYGAEIRLLWNHLKGYVLSVSLLLILIEIITISRAYWRSASPTYDLFRLVRAHNRTLNLLVYDENGKLMREFCIFKEPLKDFRKHCLELLRSDLLVTATPQIILFSTSLSPSPNNSQNTVWRQQKKANFICKLPDGRLVGASEHRITVYNLKSDTYPQLEEIYSFSSFANIRSMVYRHDRTMFVLSMYRSNPGSRRFAIYSLSDSEMSMETMGSYSLNWLAGSDTLVPFIHPLLVSFIVSLSPYLSS